MRLLRRKDLVCRDAVQLMSDYLEDALSSRQRARLESHLADCPHCSEYLRQMQTVMRAVGHVEPDDLSASAREELVAVYRRWRAA
jgi:anti-sigma factor RsiW